MPCNTTSGLPMLGCCGGVITEGIINKYLVVNLKMRDPWTVNVNIDMNDYLEYGFQRLFELSFDDIEPQRSAQLTIDVPELTETLISGGAPGGSSGGATARDGLILGQSLWQIYLGRVLWISGPGILPCISLIKTPGPVIKECGAQTLPHETFYTYEDGLIVKSATLRSPESFDILHSAHFPNTPRYGERPECCDNPAP